MKQYPGLASFHKNGHCASVNSSGHYGEMQAKDPRIAVVTGWTTCAYLQRRHSHNKPEPNPKRPRRACPLHLVPNPSSKRKNPGREIHARRQQSPPITNDCSSQAEPSRLFQGKEYVQATRSSRGAHASATARTTLSQQNNVQTSFLPQKNEKSRLFLVPNVEPFVVQFLQQQGQHDHSGTTLRSRKHQ